MLETPQSAAIVERLNALHPRVIDLSLGRIERLLARLGNPERRMPPVIHVAGTNGKGSTVAIMRAIAEAAGLRVHVYTSPHLVRFNERIRVAGRLIEDAELLRLIDVCEAANAGEPITFFEITTALAFVAFAETPADLTLLETGLGGRLDATNVIDRPAATAITPVSIDHVGFLGDTLAKIAGEKAGILKPGVPCTVAQQDDEARTVIEARAGAVGAPLHWQRDVWHATHLGSDRMRVETARRTLDLPLPNLAGEHQLANAAQAIATLDARAAPLIDADAVARGVTQAEWPARLQRLTKGPLVDALAAGWELWVDGGHNPGAGSVIGRQAHAWRAKQPGRPLDLVFGILNTKDPDGFLAPIAPSVRRLAALTIPDEEASISRAEAALVARRLGMEAFVADSVADALARLTRDAVPGRILVCGSLYLAGVVLAENGSTPL